MNKSSGHESVSQNRKNDKADSCKRPKISDSPKFPERSKISDRVIVDEWAWPKISDILIPAEIFGCVRNF